MLEDLLKDLDAPEIPVTAARRRRFGWLSLSMTALAGAMLADRGFSLASHAGRRKSAPADTPHGDGGLGAEWISRAFERRHAAGFRVRPRQRGQSRHLASANRWAEADSTDARSGGRNAPVLFAGRHSHRISLGERRWRHLRRAALGGDPRLLVAGGREPRFSPDGRLIAYWTGREGTYQPGSSRVFVVEASGGQPRPVHPEMAWAMHPLWSPKGDELLVLGMRDRGEPGRPLTWKIGGRCPSTRRTPKRTGVIPRPGREVALGRLALGDRPDAARLDTGRRGPRIVRGAIRRRGESMGDRASRRAERLPGRRAE